MGPFKGEVPVFARLWPVRPPWRAPRRRLTLAGPTIIGLGLVVRLGSTVGHPSNSWASCCYLCLVGSSCFSMSADVYISIFAQFQFCRLRCDGRAQLPIG